MTGTVQSVFAKDVSPERLIRKTAFSRLVHRMAIEAEPIWRVIPMVSAVEHMTVRGVVSGLLRYCGIMRS